MSSLNLFRAPGRAPVFFDVLAWLLAIAACCLIPGVIPDLLAAEDVHSRLVVNSDYPTAREALIESIEAEGLVVSAVIPFGGMLERTAGGVGKGVSPYLDADIVQFCSARLARQLVEEDAAQIALCPLSITVYVPRSAPGQIVYVYRSPGLGSPGRIAAGVLLQGLVNRALTLARLR